MVQEAGSGDTGQKPIKLGGALFTMVEPHRGHEVDYNRWYERDHFYAGCMIGAWTISGARFVATKACKERRFPEDSPITPDPMVGSYLALYWILAGKFDEWMKWGTKQVVWLHENNRMFPHRDHVHTLMYRFLDEHGREDGVPIELALDHRFAGVVAIIGEPTEGHSAEEVRDWWKARPPVGETMAAFTPVPLFNDAPSDVPRDTATERFLQLFFVDDNPLAVWDQFEDYGAALDNSGLGRVLFASPYLATSPGTDKYTDELW